MDFSEFEVWSMMVQFGVLCVILLIGNTFRRYIPIFRKSLLPTSVIAGILALILRSAVLLDFLTSRFLNMITYHFMAIGFIALSLKTAYGKGEVKRSSVRDGVDSGLLIVGTYLLQGVLGFGITLILAATFMPDLFKSAGLLLPLGFGQGPGQANNWGYIYENTVYTNSPPFAGGQTFSLAVSSIGFIAACIPGVIYMTYLMNKGAFNTAKGFKNETVSNELGSEDEIPLADSIDKFTVQVCFVMMTFLISFGIMKVIDLKLIENGVLGSFGVKTLRPLIWGFNFIFGTLCAIIIRSVLKFLRRFKWMKRDYLNNFMLNRITGTAFDFMVVASILLIDIKVLSSLLVPLLLLSAAGMAATFWYVKKAAGVIYAEYPLEGFLGMYGMLTGTASTGVALLREADPDFDTPASQNMVTGSSFAIAFGFPMLALLGIAPEHPYITLALLTVFFIIINICMFRSVLKRVFTARKT